MPDIKITFAEVRAKNQQIRKHNQTLDDTLKQIKNIINALEADWTPSVPKSPVCSPNSTLTGK